MTWREPTSHGVASLDDSTDKPASGSILARVGIDIGGTFTDLAAVDHLGREVHLKTPTVPEDPIAGVVRGLELLEQRGISGPNIGYLVHGTTLALNTIIQRSGARVALLATAGFRDVLELGRLRLPQPWSFYSARPAPLIPRELVIPVRERMGVDGTIVQALDRAEIDRVAEAVAEADVQSVAICLLHAYAAPAHEIALADAIAKRLPHVLVSRSSDLWPQAREYERALVTVMNAYVQPAISRYLGKFGAALIERNVAVRPYITKSNGGIMTAEAARERVVQTLLSGPAAGVVGAVEVARSAGASDVITLDVGGTSADVAVIRAGVPVASHDERVGDFSVVVPAVGVSAIGAGGGSIAWFDAAGVLKVGPRSAGSAPGPVCYGSGGTEPTLTDAFVVAGYMSPSRFAGRSGLRVDLATEALAALGARLKLDAPGAADAVIRVALANMYTELSSVMERHGLDQREFTLLPLGGAGPVVAAQLADELRIGNVLVPRSPGTLCAWGALHAEVASDFIRNVGAAVGELDSERIQTTVDSLAAEANQWLLREAPATSQHQLRWTADMRYRGQSYEIEVPLKLEWLRATSAEALECVFHDAHQRVFSHHDPSGMPEIVSLRLRAIGTVDDARRATSTFPRDPTLAVLGQSRRRRMALFAGTAVETSLYERDELEAGHVIAGPSVVEQQDSTVVIPPNWVAEVAGDGTLLLKRAGGDR